eukprot:668945-Amphidinium_carterae.1
MNFIGTFSLVPHMCSSGKSAQISSQSRRSLDYVQPGISRVGVLPTCNGIESAILARGSLLKSLSLVFRLKSLSFTTKAVSQTCGASLVVQPMLQQAHSPELQIPTDACQPGFAPCWGFGLKSFHILPHDQIIQEKQSYEEHV